MSVMNDFVMEETIISNFPILGGVRLFSTYLSLLFVPVGGRIIDSKKKPGLHTHSYALIRNHGEVISNE